MNQKSKLILLGILFVGFFAFLVYNLKKAGWIGSARRVSNAARTTETEKESKAMTAVPPKESIEELHVWLAPDEATRADTNGRFGIPQKPGDKTKPPPPGEEPLPVFSGTIGIGDGPRQAILNNKPYRKGDKVAGTLYTLSEIGVDTVQVIDEQGKTYTINLLQ